LSGLGVQTDTKTDTNFGAPLEFWITGGNSPVTLWCFGVGFGYNPGCVKNSMKTRYRLTCRGSRGGKFYCVDTQTGKRTSLQTGIEEEARQLIEAKNQAQRQPVLNLQIAKAYLAAADSNYVRRTWSEVMAEFVKTKTGSNRTRSERAVLDKSFDSIRDRQLIETRAEHFLRVLESGRVSTNNYLRRFHNFAADMGWLPWPVLPKRQWPAIHYKEKRAITWEEHELILRHETNSDMRAFIWCCWHISK
jgi:hypothetical protein